MNAPAPPDPTAARAVDAPAPPSIFADPQRAAALLLRMGRVRNAAVSICGLRLAAAADGAAPDPDRMAEERARLDEGAPGLADAVAALLPDHGLHDAEATFAAVRALAPDAAPPGQDAAALFRRVDAAASTIDAAIDRIVSRSLDAQGEERRSVSARGGAVLAMCDEMEEIGRTIHLISLNAAVEAARAGGESGRVFGTISQEVRTLASRAAKVVGDARARIEDAREG